jgi:hypothetical protein
MYYLYFYLFFIMTGMDNLDHIRSEMDTVNHAAHIARPDVLVFVRISRIFYPNNMAASKRASG